MQKVTRNTFSKGINTDIESGKLPPEQYTEAHNVELVGDNQFFAIKNIKGTTEYEVITQADGAEVIGVFENTYKINGVNKKCLTIFTMEDYNVLEADPVTYILTGTDVNLYKSAVSSPSYTLTASPATYNTTGTAATFSITYAYLIKGTEYSKVNACSLVNVDIGGTPVYTTKSSPSAFIVGTTQLFTDSAMTSPFFGSGVGNFYKIRNYASGAEYGVEVSAGGYIISRSAC
jgi:hypothetical protein